MGTGTREHTVRSSDGTEIGVVTVGSGRPLVLVHGAWNWREHWLDVAEQLADSHTCWVMDRRGRGISGDGDRYSFDREIDDITAVLLVAGPDASLLGHSSGAIYALETARRNPVDRLVLYEPPLRWAERGDPSDVVDRIRALVDQDRLEEAAELFFREEGRLADEGLAFLKTLPEWEPMVALAPICVREWDAILEAHLSVDQYRKLPTPTLLLTGSENLDHPSMATESLSATLPDARTAVLDGHGHMAHRTDPTLVADEVRAFLREGSSVSGIEATSRGGGRDADRRLAAPVRSGDAARAGRVVEELRFASGNDECAATLYRPAGGGQVPCVVMGNGVSLTRFDGLPRFAERFVDGGFAALTFDFRHLGESGGEPRQLIDVKRQTEDFAAAVGCARSLDGIDAGRVAVWGYSLGGGVALSVAAGDDRLAAAVLMTPMVDGLAFTLALPNTMYITAATMRALLRRDTAKLPVVGPPGSPALLTQPEAVPNTEALVAPNSPWRNEVQAKPSQPAALFRPVRAARRVRCPLLVCVGSNDTIVPPGALERTAEQAPRGELRRYPINHAEGFLDGFDDVARDQVEFLHAHLETNAA